MDQQKVMIYGAGQCGKIIRTFIKHKWNFIGFIDGKADLLRGSVDGFPVIHPDTIPEYDPDLIIIAVLNVEQSRLIMDQLLEKGFGRECIIPIRSMKEYLDARFSAARLIASEIVSRGVQGAIAELGVYQGEFAALLNKLFTDRSLYLFDTFEGFDKKDLSIEAAEKFSSAGTGDFRDTSIETVKGRLPYPEWAVFRKGWFPDTAVGIEENYAFVSIDADLYNPVYEGLKYFYPRMNHGGYILIHDYNSLQYKGAGKAVRQYCAENGLFVVPLSDMHGSAVLVKP